FQSKTQIFCPDNTVLRNKMEERFCFLFCHLFLHIRNDSEMMEIFFRKLCVRIKAPDGFNFITVKFHPVRQFVRKRKHIHNSAPYCKLPGFENKICPLKTIVNKKI